MNTETCQMMLALAPGIGPRTAAILLERLGSAEAVIHAGRRVLMRIPGMGPVRADALKAPALAEHAEREIECTQQHGIRRLFLTDPEYPGRLRHCGDAPLMLFYKGNADLNAARTVAVVGTRKNTPYGAGLCNGLVEALSGYGDILVLSGLAYGIDALAHRACVRQGMATVGVLAHGLDRIYPPVHRRLAQEMLATGGLLTEFPSGTEADKTNFPVRNRIVAGMSDVTVVVESGTKGGALITAYLAAGYHREVAAFPGRTEDESSAGCHMLIRTQVASLITSAGDLADLMGWHLPDVRKREPDMPCSGEAARILEQLRGRAQVHADELQDLGGMDSGQLSAGLLELELQGRIRALPGRYYKLQ